MLIIIILITPIKTAYGSTEGKWNENTECTQNNVQKLDDVTMTIWLIPY